MIILLVYNFLKYNDLIQEVILHFHCICGLLAGGEDHPGHPEEYDVVAGDQHVGGIEVVQVGGLLRPAQGGEGPQGGGEPGVQHVRVPGEVGAAAVLADLRVLPGAGHLAAVGAVPHRDLVAPPELAGDAPVVDLSLIHI